MLDVLRDWQNFYVLMGGASATLTGLMFVAVSLGMNLVNDASEADIHTYVSPTLFHFVASLLLAGIVLMAGHTPLSFAFLVGTLALVGLWKVIGVIRRMQQSDHATSSEQIHEDHHWLWHGILPLVAYALMGFAGIGQALSTSSLLLTGLALAEALLLICAIRNTWILVLWIARQH